MNMNMDEILLLDSKLYNKHTLKDLNDKSYEPIFTDIANNLFNKSLFMINNSSYRITEIEFYLHYDSHKDIYTHRHIDQSVPCKFYFHKQGKTNTYKGGTYKGLDITFGLKNNNTNSVVYGGILIRAIQNIVDKTEIIGPCKVVDKILELNGVSTIESMVQKIENLSATKKSSLYLIVDEKNQLEEKTITVSPRVGLSFGYPNYVLRNYRYLINAKTNDKYKSAVVINLYKDVKYNGDVKKISEITNVSVTQINKYITQYKNSMNLDIVLKDLKPSNTTIIQVMGYCDKPLVQNTKK
jgi:hypothetical protein